ncbi:MAG: hypothetical protein PVI59_10110 [Anaerolineae bacterium]|jgi:uncharacterized membrane protein YesL
MAEALRTIRRAGRLFLGDLYLFFLVNLLTALSFFLVIPFPPALAGLCLVARRAAEGKFVRVRDWWEGLTRYFWRAWALALINLAFLGLTIYNIRFYGPAGRFPVSEPAWLPAALQGALAALLAFWLAWQLYVLPLMVEEEHPRVLRLLGQALLLLVGHPFYSVTLLVVIALLLVISTIAFGVGFFVTPAAVALLVVVATRQLLGREDPEP